MDFDVSIKGAHIDPTESSLITGVVVDIESVESTNAGEKPVVNFTLKDRKGNPLNPATINRIAFTLAGPTTDYGEGLPTKGGYATESAPGATATRCLARAGRSESPCGKHHSGNRESCIRR